MRSRKFKTFAEFVAEGLIKAPGTQLGSNEGGIHTDEAGQKFYVKHYNNPDQAKVEALTGKIYGHMGIHTVNPEHKVIDSKHSVSSKWNDNLERMEPHHFESLTPKQAGQIGKMYHAAILTKNWDIVGLEHDNILKNKNTGDLHSVDTGGAFHFRARGSNKQYGPDIDEHSSLKKENPQAAHVFNSVFKSHPTAEKDGIKAVRALDDNKIHTEFKNSGLSNWKDLHANFMERKKKLLSKYE